jgi:hypothetical protein
MFKSMSKKYSINNDQLKKIPFSPLLSWMYNTIKNIRRLSKVCNFGFFFKNGYPI